MADSDPYHIDAAVSFTDVIARPDYPIHARTMNVNVQTMMSMYAIDIDLAKRNLPER